MYKHLSFKGPSNFTEFWCFIFHLGCRTFAGDK